MKQHLAAVLGICLCAASAHAGSNDDLEQVIQNASKGQNAETSAQVRDFAESHRDEISGITQGYRAYINQIQAMTNDNGQMPVASVTGTNAAAAQLAGQTAAAAVQPQTGLQTASLQPSSGLVTSHLDGSTPLPDAAPVSSLLHPTAEQLQQGSAAQAAMQARKRSLMQTPLRYQD